MPIKSDLQQLQHSPIIELYDFDLTTIGVQAVHYFCNEQQTDGSNVRWKGRTYIAIPIESSGWQASNEGVLPRPTIKISNVFGIGSTLSRQYQDLYGTKVIRRRTLLKYLDGQPTADPNQEFPLDIFYIERKSLENKLIVEWELAANFRPDVKVPLRDILTRCPWKYRGAECGYNSQNGYFTDLDVRTTDPTKDVCGKRLKSCEIRFGANAPLPWGGFIVDIT